MLVGAMIRQPESWTHRVLVPDWRWEHPGMSALADCADYLGFLAWAQTDDGRKNRNRPTPFSRPQFNNDDATTTDDEFVAVTSDELDEILGRNREVIADE